MFYSEDSGSFFGGESEYWDDATEFGGIENGYGGNEIGSGGTISDIGRDFPGLDNGGVIEGGSEPLWPGESEGSGTGNPDGAIAGQAEEEKEEGSLLVEQADDNEGLVEFIVSVIDRIEQENKDEASADAASEDGFSTGADMEPASESVYTIDDVYAVLEEIKTCCVSIQDENKSYHVGQDITGRMAVAGLFMILGGIVVYAFVGRIR